VNLGSPQFAVAAARRMLYRAGLDQDDMAGQVTLRADDDPGSYWTSPMETFDVTVPESVVKVRFDLGEIRGGVTRDGRFSIDGGGAVPVSTASGWVGGILAVRPDVACVIHTHARHIAAVASAGRTIELYNNRALVFYDDQAFYDDDGTNTDSREGIVAALGSRNVLVMRNHGAAVVGETIEQATMRAILLERAAEVQVLAAAVGGSPFPDNPDFARRRIPHVANLPLLWDSHLRRLRRTDPDLFAYLDEHVPA
jgi:L-fuculose-phosphate aldolase